MIEGRDGGQNGSRSFFAPAQGKETTGRYLVLFREEAVPSGAELLRDAAGMNVATSGDFEAAAVAPDQISGADAVLFQGLGVAVVSSAPDQLQSLGDETEGAILAIEPERVMYALGSRPALALDEELASVSLSRLVRADVPTGGLLPFLQGYREGIETLVERLISLQGAGTVQEAEPLDVDESQDTWGLQATRVTSSTRSGRGIRVAVLDTGMDLTHPDFAGRTVVARSFVEGQQVQDGHGHGTHCIGTACGPLRPGVLPRYGVAHEAEIYAGKVLSDSGSGGDTGILAGIEWAVRNRCKVISMSLGAPTRPGDPPSLVYETTARRALRKGSLIVAAAGNESDRRIGHFSPVGRPANSPSIMAVAAVDKFMEVAFFSCRAINPNGGEINVAGPGVDVHSTWPMATRYRTISGTSMATPHVAGIAALMFEADPQASARQIWKNLTSTARALPFGTEDVGAGLVQATDCQPGSGMQEET